jgi:hypothetical protein
MTFTRLVLAALAACTACRKSRQMPQTSGPPAALWARGYDATLFARALDISCAPPDAQPGVEGCLALVRYQGRLNGVDVPVTLEPYGNIIFVRTDASGLVVWSKVLMSGFDPIAQQTGAFVDDDLRVRMLANGLFLVSGTYERRVFIGTPGGDNQEFGPASNRNLFVIIFNANGTINGWGDTGNALEQHALGAALLPNTNTVTVGSCQGDVPLADGTMSCGSSTHGFVLVSSSSTGLTVRAIVFGGTRPSEASDVVADAAGNLYVSGSFEGKMKFGTNPDDVAAGADDGFLMKVGGDGVRAWIVTAGGLGHDRGGRLARVAGAVLWTSRVSDGARVGRNLFPQAGHVVAKIDDSGTVLWARRIPQALSVAPLGIAAADDGSFALYGDGFLGRYQADGTQLWLRGDADTRGAAFTKTALIVAATVIGVDAFDAQIALSGDDAIRAALVGFAR